MAERHRKLLAEKRTSENVVLSSKGYYQENPDGSKVWKRDEIVVTLEGNVVVTVDMKAIEDMIFKAFRNSGRRCQRGGIRVVVIGCHEIPNTRRERTV